MERREIATTEIYTTRYEAEYIVFQDGIQYAIYYPVIVYSILNYLVL
jgi:hypothetical protein